LFIDIRVFDSRLYLDISRSFKWKESFIFRYFQDLSSEQNRLYLDSSRPFNCSNCSPVVCLICYYLRSVRSLVVFVLRECILKVHILVSSEHKLCQTWNTCIVPCIYWSIALLSRLLILFLTKLTTKSHIYQL
jgi:hypothetical protein